MKTKLWIDDIRTPPTGEWIWAKNYDDAIAQIFTGNFVRVSLDHDLGDENAKTGYDILCEIERQIAKGGFWIFLPEFEIHSANPVGRANMQRAIDSIWKLYKELKNIE